MSEALDKLGLDNMPGTQHLRNTESSKFTIERTFDQSPTMSLDLEEGTVSDFNCACAPTPLTHLDHQLNIEGA